MGARYDIVALTSNDLVTDRRMHRCLATLTGAGYRCLLLGRERGHSLPLDRSLPFAQERHRLSAEAGKRFYYQLNRAHRRRLLELRPRAILVVDLDTMWAGAGAAAELATPWVHDAHELFVEQPEVARRPLVRAAWEALARRYIGGASAAYSVGDAIASELTHRYAFPFQVVRNLPLAAAEAPGGSGADPEEPYTVLYQGALNEGRGLEELIRAAAVLPAVRFWIAGDGPRAGALRTFARAEGAENVRFLGELRPDELAERTPRADLGYALMRRISESYYLSLSNKSLDYIQAGIPSLQMDWPEYRAIEERFGCYHLVPEVSPGAVVAAIRACRVKSYARQLREGCRRAAAALHWEAEAPRLLAIWSDVFAADRLRSAR